MALNDDLFDLLFTGGATDPYGPLGPENPLGGSLASYIDPLALVMNTLGGWGTRGVPSKGPALPPRPWDALLKEVQGFLDYGGSKAQRVDYFDNLQGFGGGSTAGLYGEMDSYLWELIRAVGSNLPSDILELFLLNKAKLMTKGDLPIPGPWSWN